MTGVAAPVNFGIGSTTTLPSGVVVYVAWPAITTVAFGSFDVGSISRTLLGTSGTDGSPASSFDSTGTVTFVSYAVLAVSSDASGCTFVTRTVNVDLPNASLLSAT